MQTIVLFSGGLGSWAAAKRLADRGVEDLVLLFTDTRTEDEDLYRWLVQSAANVGAPLVCLADGRDVWQVFNDTNFIGNSRVDICSRVLKRELARKWINKLDPAVTEVALGIDWSEIHRYERAKPRWEPYNLIAPMCDEPWLTKDDVQQWAKDEGLRIPRLYEWSAHNNCGGFCVKAGQGQFAKLLENMPERYAYHEQKERDFRERTGKDVAIMKDRTGGTTKPLTMEALRIRVETKQAFEADEIGGCGCMVDGDDE